MVVFPNAKINLGLHILRRRTDGYHDIETIMFPVPWCDILEIVPAASTHPAGSSVTADGDTLTVTGRVVDCPADKNLVVRAVRATRAVCAFGLVDIFLHKVIPDGAGLGGGSSDAAFAVMALNSLFGLGLTDLRMADIAASVGSDCPFFIFNRPMLATGRGVDLNPVNVNLSRKWIVIVKPQDVYVSTAQAYAGVIPDPDVTPLTAILRKRLNNWNGVLVNHFEPSVFALAPAIAETKQRLYDMGAVYAAMSGSGAAVFAIFDHKPDLSSFPASSTFSFLQP